LVTKYWVEKNAIFRTWGRMRPMDDGLAKDTSKFVALAVLVHVMVSARLMVSWPFDSLCQTQVCRGFTQTCVQRSSDKRPRSQLAARRPSFGAAPTTANRFAAQHPNASPLTGHHSPPQLTIHSPQLQRAARQHSPCLRLLPSPAPFTAAQALVSRTFTTSLVYACCLRLPPSLAPFARPPRQIKNGTVWQQDMDDNVARARAPTPAAVLPEGWTSAPTPLGAMSKQDKAIARAVANAHADVYVRCNMEPQYTYPFVFQWSWAGSDSESESNYELWLSPTVATCAQVHLFTTHLPTCPPAHLPTYPTLPPCLPIHSFYCFWLLRLACPPPTPPLSLPSSLLAPLRAPCAVHRQRPKMAGSDSPTALTNGSPAAC
jgi:hypothetical protein